MDLSELKENIVDEKVKYRNFEINIKIKPDAEVSGDEINSEYLAIKLAGWDITDKGNAVSPDEKTISQMWSKNPELMTAILKKVNQVVNAPLGKPN